MGTSNNAGSYPIPTMTFARSLSKGEREKGDKNERTNPVNRKAEQVEEKEKPEHFFNRQHEIDWELTDHKRRLIMRVERSDFVGEIEDYSDNMSDDFILKNPINYDARVTSIKTKIFNASGIMPHCLDITRVSISTKKVKLAWVCFKKPKTVTEIFCLAVQNGNMTKFNAFPHVPGKATLRKEGLETILKSLQNANKQFRYQIRLGLKDLEVW